MERKCDKCGKVYNPDMRNVKRGWGLCCSKSCAASKREESRAGYDPNRVAKNNERRKNWKNNYQNREESWMYDDDQGWDAHKDTF